MNFFPSGAPVFRGDSVTSSNFVTGTNFPSGAPVFCGDPRTYNNFVTGPSDNLSSLTTFCGVHGAQS